ncbi:MAG: hypothetical protein JWO12_3516 [Frankiales bacterium]|nr:hypothetical protein [Frankiales bacterium]
MRRRTQLLVGIVIVVLAVLGWTARRAWQVRSDLTAAQSQATYVQHQLTAGDAALAENALPTLRNNIQRAVNHSGGPTWAVVQHVPVLGANLAAVRRTALAAQALGRDALPEATAALHIVQRDKPVHDGKVDLAVLSQLQEHVARSAVATARARSILGTSDGLAIGAVSSRVDEARAKVVQLDDALHNAQKALRLAPSMLGADGPRTYFLAVQNNAEARATGGLIGAFALITADHGTLTLDRTGADGPHQLKTALAAVPFDPASAATWREAGSNVAWYDANLTPHFPDAARNMAGLWTAQSGHPIDGVLAIDPLVMRQLLIATGPIALADGFPVTADSVVDFVAHDEYVRYPDTEKRKALVSGLAEALFHAVVAAKEPVKTLQGLARAGSSGHLLLWSAHAEDQSVLESTLVGGALPKKDLPYLSVITQNYGGNKLDYYLHRKVVVTPAKEGYLTVTTTLTNGAPTGLPLYMHIRADNPTGHLPYGQALVGISVYGALTSEIRNVTVDGKPVKPLLDKDHGHPFGTFTLELPRNTDVVVSLQVREPKGTLVYHQQPLMAPDELDIQVHHRIVGS